MSNIDTLREHLFSTLQALQDKENPMDIDRAKAVCEVGQVIINSAKAEIDFLRANGSVQTTFFQQPGLALPNRLKQDDRDDEEQATTHGVVSINHTNGQRIVTHRMK